MTCPFLGCVCGERSPSGIYLLCSFALFSLHLNKLYVIKKLSVLDFYLQLISSAAFLPWPELKEIMSAIFSFNFQLSKYVYHSHVNVIFSIIRWKTSNAFQHCVAPSCSSAFSGSGHNLDSCILIC